MKRTTTEVQKAKILVVGSTPPPLNGMSVFLNHLLHSRIAEEFEIILLDTADRRPLSNIGRLDLTNVRLALLHGARFLRLALTRRPDLVYVPIAQNVLGYLRDSLFLVPSRLLGKRVVVHLHGSEFREFYRSAPFWMRPLVRFTLADVRRMIVLGENLRGLFAGLVPDGRIAVVPYGIEPAVPPQAGPESRRNGRRQVLYLGTLTKNKGFLDVLRSAPLILEKLPAVQFNLAGEHYRAEDRQASSELIAAHGLEGAVRMPGVVAGLQKAQALHQADIFVFPPVAPEGQPLVILEAMSAGLPVIATPQGAIPETVVDGETGFLVPPGSPQAIADKVLLLFADDELRRRMGEAGRRRFLERYTLECWTEKMERLFREVLAE